MTYLAWSTWPPSKVLLKRTNIKKKNFASIVLLFLPFQLFCTKKQWKIIFKPVFGVPINQIYNTRLRHIRGYPKQNFFKAETVSFVLFQTFSICVVYFDHPTGAPQAVCWSKSFVSTLKQVFSSFSITNRKKERKKKFSPGVNQLLRVTPKRWQTPFYDIFFCIFLTFIDRKSCFIDWKRWKKLFQHQKHDSHQRMAWGAPVCWSKYTTYLHY